MNMLGLDMNDNIKGRTASVRIVANFGSQILHLPRFLTPLAISRKFHANPLRGFLCNTNVFPQILKFQITFKNSAVILLFF